MPMTSVPWMGNRVEMAEIDGTELTTLEWHRPWNGTRRGFRILGTDELTMVCRAVEEVVTGLRPAPRLADLAGRPLDMETFLSALLDR